MTLNTQPAFAERQEDSCEKVILELKCKSWKGASMQRYANRKSSGSNNRHELGCSRNRKVAMTWMDLEVIMLSEIRHRTINTIWFHLHAESKEQKEQTNQKKTQKYRGQSGDSHRGRGFGRLEERDEGLKKYELIVDRWSWGWGAQHRECSQQ